MEKINVIFFNCILLLTIPLVVEIKSSAQEAPVPVKTRPSKEVAKNRSRTTAEKPTTSEDLQLLEENLLISFAGPVQYETFGNSNQTGEQKYDPNLISYGVALRWRRNRELFSLGPSLIFRGFRTYENATHMVPEGSTEAIEENVNVSAFNLGGGYIFSTKLSKTSGWNPYTGLFFEYSQASVSRAVLTNSFQEGSDTSVGSKKLFSYWHVASAWAFDLPGVTITSEINLTIPIRTWHQRSSTTPAQDQLLDRLQHKQAPGLGLSLGIGQWL